MHSVPHNHEVPSRGLLLPSSGRWYLRLLEHDDAIIEYQVERVRGGSKVGLGDGVLIVAVFLFTFAVVDVYKDWSLSSRRGIFLILGLMYIWSRAMTVHRESSLVFPTIGLQLETHRGLYLFGRQFTTTVSRVFIPVSAISDIIINEGLCGWNVRRYLAILPAREPRLQVVFENLDPPFDIIREVYHGLRETLFDEWEGHEPDAGAEPPNTMGKQPQSVGSLKAYA